MQTINDGREYKTKKRYERCLTDFIVMGRFAAPGQITQESILAVLDGLRAKNYAESTIKIYFSCIKVFMAFMVERGYIHADPSAKIKKPVSLEPKEISYLTEDEEAQVLRIASIYRIYWPVKLALYSGARREELCLMTWEKVDVRAKIMRIPSPKVGTVRSVPISDELWADMTYVEPKFGPLVGCGARRPTTAATLTEKLMPVQQAMPKISGWHIFRHTFASRLAQRGVSLAKISKWLGHASYDVTLQYYANFSTDNYDADINRLSEPRRP